MKKKLLSLFVVVALAAVAAGSTLAYFTDEDSADNTFTIGNLDIALNEKFDDENAHLVPGKDIQKEITVTNQQGVDSYVRVHIAIPSSMDDGDPSFAAVNNFLHFNFDNASVVDGQWSWGVASNYPGTGSDDWNFYTTTIDEVDYNVYVVTYETALKAGQATETAAMTKVYLDPTVDADSKDGVVTYTDSKGHEIELAEDAEISIRVIAEGVQAEGFANAFDALNAGFGVPGEYNAWA